MSNWFTKLFSGGKTVIIENIVTNEIGLDKEIKINHISGKVSFSFRDINLDEQNNLNSETADGKKQWMYFEDALRQSL